MRKLLTLLLLFTSYSAFSGVSFVDGYNVSAQETGPREIAFSSDGTKFFVTGYQGSDVGEYSMSTAWDVSTASYTDAFSVSSQTGAGAHGLAFNTNGTKMFVMSYGSDQVHEYALSTGWDVSTASYTDGFDVSSQDTEPRGLAFSTDGTKMFISGNTGNDINEYTLSTGFDVSTASYVDSLDVSSYDTDVRGMAFNDDGTTLFFHGQQNDKVHSWKLSTGYDISTATYDNFVNLPSFDTGAEAIVFNNDGTKLFVSGNNDNTIDEYTVSTGFELINTAPTLSSSSPSEMPILC
jgi:6-phosphogluconolactonase (cycloisomerase 2 family)